MEGIKNASTAKIIGKAILLASIQSALGSVEMSSKFSVLNFSKDAETLQNAANALSSYMLIGTIWAIGASISLYSSYGNEGLIWGIITNVVMLGWIYFSYTHSFSQASKKFNVPYPKMFRFF